MIAPPPVVVALGVFGALASAVFFACVARTGGQFVYPLDDAYIHLAMAKNIADHHVYGVTPFEFSASSSSIAWPLLLAAARAIFGSAELLPLVVNAVAGGALVGVAGKALHDEHAGDGVVLAAALSLVLFVPLVPLVFTGMEHTPHALLIFFLANEIARALSGEPRPWRLGLLAAAAASLRYETFFLLAPALVLFALLRGKHAKSAAFLAGGGALPVLAQGAFSLSRGAYFFPTSVLIKRADLHLTTAHALVYQRLLENPHVLVLLVLLAGAYGARSFRAGPGERKQILLFLSFAMLALHVVFARLGWLYRYEGYAMALGIFALWSASWERLRDWTAPREGRATELTGYAVALFLLTLPITARGFGALTTTVIASGNIYDQQYQMASFVREYYAGRGVVLNDIGAVTYLADVHLTDLMGLGTMRAAKAKGLRIDGGLERSDVDTLARKGNGAIAILYDDWFGDAIPREWRRVAMWKITDNRVCGKDTVSFYAIGPEEEAPLRTHLAAFALRLPGRVRVLGP